MLQKIPAKALQDAARSYLGDTLGIEPAVHLWSGAAKLPYFLQDEFELYELKVKERSILLAVNRRKATVAPAALRERMNKLRSVADHPVVYVTGALASYERKRLIEQKIPFIVPGNQLYLPDLGIDLREYFRQPAQAALKALSPATQAMLIRALLSESTQHTWHPAAMAADLGYTKMTVSRVVNELVSAGIAKLTPRGRARWVLMERPPAETWQMARPMLRTPVKRQFWAGIAPALSDRRLALAGLSALAFYTQLAEPSLPVYAIGATRLEALDLGEAELPEPMPNSCQLQVWSYEPMVPPGATAHGKKAIDPLSLSLSFGGVTDERIELALEEMKEHFPWSGV